MQVLSTGLTSLWWLRLLICSLSFLSILCEGAQPAVAKFASRQTRQVPIARLLKNLELKRSELGASTTDKALVDFQMGRLHAMAYALKVESGATDARAFPNSRFELPDFGDSPDHIQFTVTPVKDAKKLASATSHLKLAIALLQKSSDLDSQFLPAKLGLAWCLDQSGQRARALSLYRAVFKEAYELERTTSGGMYNWSIAVETAEYLCKLLDPSKDASEIKDIKQKTSELNRLPRYVTPIAIPLRRNLSADSLLVNSTVEFDLDGKGKQLYRQWLTPDAGWLVFDAENSGIIESGLQLIGSVSFWVFWRNGYEVLSALDDNKDGELRDGELEHFYIWQDINVNGLSESGEVQSLKHWGITALATDGICASDSLLMNSSGVRFSNGECRPTWDLILQPSRRK